VDFVLDGNEIHGWSRIRKSWYYRTTQPERTHRRNYLIRIFNMLGISSRVELVLQAWLPLFEEAAEVGVLQLYFTGDGRTASAPPDGHSLQISSWPI
jgi:hypothetical protein